MDELIPISNASLDMLRSDIRVPRYDRAGLKPGIVHIGLGNFHRAHQAWYLHRLFDQGLCYDWAIVGAGVRPDDAQQREKLQRQDFLTTLIELDPSGKSAEICGSMIDFVEVAEGHTALIDRMAAPDIRIVSLTITEGGYYLDPAQGTFATEHEDIQYDAAHPDQPRTVFGAMVAALRERRRQGQGPFTGLSCDNLQGNGDILKSAVVGLAHMSDPGLAAWIESECSFPNSVVDCIVPATGPREVELAQAYGIDDAVPVTHENFRQWIIEDDFCAGRPDWDRAGAIFSDRIHEYEAMKLRILNGGHQVIAAAGDLLGLRTIAETMAHPLLRPFLRRLAIEEITPHITALPEYDAAAYFDLVERRFSNPEIADTTRRVAFDGSSRQPSFIIPSISDGLKSGQSIEGLALVSAIWARYCQGLREDGSQIEANDPHWQLLKAVAQKAKETPPAWIQMRQYYGDLAEQPRFADAFGLWLRKIYTDGLEASIATYLAR